jgi:YesN/AraC family two-component response regulator
MGAVEYGSRRLIVVNGVMLSALLQTFDKNAGDRMDHRRRLSAAQELLLETKQNLTTVCEAVGWRQFVRHVGVTPAQF